MRLCFVVFLWLCVFVSACASESFRQISFFVRCLDSKATDCCVVSVPAKQSVIVIGEANEKVHRFFLLHSLGVIAKEVSIKYEDEKSEHELSFDKEDCKNDMESFAGIVDIQLSESREKPKFTIYNNTNAEVKVLYDL